jgi:branched-chain amino acid transport system permease protein
VTLFQFYFLEFSAIYILLAWGIYLPFRANQIYFGALYSMCIGAYFAAYTSVNLGWPLWLVLIGAVALCVLFSSIPAFKLAALGGFPMLIATLAIFFIVETAVRNLGFLGARHGLFGIPTLPDALFLGITYGFVLIIGFCVYRLDHSHIGRAMDAVYFDRGVAATLGIDTRRLSVQLQLIASAIGGLAGVLYAYTFGGIFPEAFGFSLVLYGITIVVFGGMYTMWGIIIASPILWGVSQFLPEALRAFSVIIYGILLIVMLLVRPSGIIDRATVRAITTGSRALLQRFTGPHSQEDRLGKRR